MARTKISEFSATAADNTDIDNIDIAEGCAPSGINNAIRELMAQLKDFQTGAAGDAFNGNVVGNVTGNVTGNVNGSLGATTPNTVVATQVDITAQGDLRLQDTTGGQFVALQAPGTIATSYTLTLPVDDGNSGQVMVTDGSGVLSWSTPAVGDVVGPASSTDNAIARFDSTTGKLLQNSAATIDDTGNISDQLGNVRDIPKSGSAKTTSYTLVAGDAGQFIEIGSGGSVTIPDATMSAGDAVTLFNNTSGNITVTCSITTAYIAGTDTDKATVTLATRGVATILFVSGTVCVINGNVT